jgi:hypothetical protein
MRNSDLGVLAARYASQTWPPHLPYCGGHLGTSRWTSSSKTRQRELAGFDCVNNQKNRVANLVVQFDTWRLSRVDR